MNHPALLPVDHVLPELLEALAGHPRALLEAPPGAGKTTRVPPALLAAPWLRGRKVLMLEPRRIAARAAAAFMADACGEEVGQSVGYRIRFESRVSARTRIEVVTEGILTRIIQDDPELPEIGAILFDEFHERHLQGDLGAALALDVQANLRPDLRLVVMSATLEGERIARWFDAPRIRSEGRSFPVQVIHPPARAGESFPEAGWPFHLRRAVQAALDENPGDVLVFLPGKREIQRAAAVLAESGGGIEIVPLHGELGLAAQRAALAAAPEGVRRVVLATNVAESSLTLPGVRAVVDLGQAREPRFDPAPGFTRLATVAISRASAEQRAGRAGRLGPGTCYRLWPESRRLEPGRRPEIAQVELSRLALELAAWGSGELPWLDPPPPGALAQARTLLQRLGALDGDGRLAAFGRDMLAFGAEPRLAAAVLRAPDAQRARACDLVALVEGRNPLRGAEARSDDFRRRVQALDAWRSRRPHVHADAAALTTIQQAAMAWRRRAGVTARPVVDEDDATRVGDLLLHAYPDRVAHRDAGDPRRYTLSNGRGVCLAADSALVGEPWLVVIDLRQESRDSLVLAAAPLDPDRLEREFASRFMRRRYLDWNAPAAAVEAFEEHRFDAIVLERRMVPVRSDEAVPALLMAVRASGLDVLPWSQPARELRARVETLRRACPDCGLPDFSEAALLATLEDWLAPCLSGKRRLDQVGAAELSGALAMRLDHGQRRRLDADAPVAVRVPSGMERRITYAFDAPPVLAVKLQELFGLADTPRIAAGRLPLTLHLLSPGGKPVQVTRDLKSFWARTYPEVKKELKGRYPKHPWPDDPWSATPTHRAKPRR